MIAPNVDALAYFAERALPKIIDGTALPMRKFPAEVDRYLGELELKC